MSIHPDYNPMDYNHPDYNPMDYNQVLAIKTRASTIGTDCKYSRGTIDAVYTMWQYTGSAFIPAQFLIVWLSQKDLEKNL